MWCAKTKNAAHQRRPVSDSTRGSRLRGSAGGVPDSPGKVLTGAPGGGVAESPVFAVSVCERAEAADPEDPGVGGWLYVGGHVATP